MRSPTLVLRKFKEGGGSVTSDIENYLLFSNDILYHVFQSDFFTFFFVE
jgi:hypothetical protein